MLGVFINLLYTHTMPNNHYCSTYMMPYPHLLAKHCLRVGRKSGFLHDICQRQWIYRSLPDIVCSVTLFTLRLYIPRLIYGSTLQYHLVLYINPTYKHRLKEVINPHKNSDSTYFNIHAINGSPYPSWDDQNGTVVVTPLSF